MLVVVFYKYHTSVRSVDTSCPMKACIVTCGIMKDSLQGRNFQVRYISGAYGPCVWSTSCLQQYKLTLHIWSTTKDKNNHSVNVMISISGVSWTTPTTIQKRTSQSYFYLLCCFFFVCLFLGYNYVSFLFLKTPLYIHFQIQSPFLSLCMCVFLSIIFSVCLALFVYMLSRLIIRQTVAALFPREDHLFPTLSFPWLTTVLCVGLKPNGLFKFNLACWVLPSLFSSC